MNFHYLFLLATALCTFQYEAVFPISADRINTPRTENLYVFSAIRGTVSRADTVTVPGRLEKISWLGGDSTSFNTQTLSHNRLTISFAPPGDFVGVTRAKLKLHISDGTQREISLTGLSTKALEGENEPPLARILDVLQYPVTVGWSSLANHCRPELQGEEIAATYFQKASPGGVMMIPVARYSPDFELAFGYYFMRADTVVRRHAGTLAKADQFPQHQILYPKIAAGSVIFDPGDQQIGFYARSPSHIAYTQDTLNKRYFPDHVVHAARIYPLKSADGKVQANSYLVCFEEAKNGDYNDYVFIVKNVKPIDHRLGSAKK